MRIRDPFRYVGALLAALLLLPLTACLPATRGGPISYNSADFKAPDAPKPAVAGDGYLISAGDVLTVNVFQAEALSREYSVDVSGNISMPLIGAVQAVGVTTKALEMDIAQKLDAKYMRNPSVTVSLKESTTRNVTVDGSVNQPGVYPVSGELTLIRAVALARGTSEHANPRRVAIFRTIDGKRMAAAFDLTRIRRGQAADPDVYAGDIVVVDGNTQNSAFRDLLSTLPVLALFRPF